MPKNLWLLGWDGRAFAYTAVALGLEFHGIYIEFYGFRWPDGMARWQEGIWPAGNRTSMVLAWNSLAFALRGRNPEEARAHGSKDAFNGSIRRKQSEWTHSEEAYCGPTARGYPETIVTKGKNPLCLSAYLGGKEEAHIKATRVEYQELLQTAVAGQEEKTKNPAVMVTAIRYNW